MKEFDKSRASQYRDAQILKNTSIFELVRRNLRDNQSGGGALKSAISDKFKGRVTRFKEKFDPLNIASMLVGRNALATTVLGRAMGRSSQDIDYFSNRKGKKGSFIGNTFWGALSLLVGKRKDEEDDDPYHTKIGSGNQRPVQRDDAIADVFAKVYNALDRMFEQEKVFKEIHENFREEQHLEEERRHKELIEALTGQKPTASPVEKKEGGGLLSMLKGLVDSFMGQFTGLMTLLAPLLGPLAGGLMALLSTLTPMLVPLLLGAGILAGVAALAKQIGDIEDSLLKKKGGEEAVAAAKEETKAFVKREEEAPTPYSEFGVTYEPSVEEDAARKKKEAAIKEKQATVQKIMADQGYTVKEEGMFGGVTYRKPRRGKGLGGEAAEDGLVFKAEQQADKMIKENATQKATATPAPPSQPKPAAPPPAATPAPPPVSSVPATPKVEASTRQNMDLNLQDTMDTQASTPVIINKGSTKSVNLGGDQTGTITGPAVVRDDALGDVFERSQRRAMIS